MINPKANRIPMSEGLRIVADLIDAAKSNGATRDPRVFITPNGVYSLTLRYDTEAPVSEIAAWQLATGVWEVHSTTFPGAGEELLRCRNTSVSYRGMWLDLAIITPAPVGVAA